MLTTEKLTELAFRLNIHYRNRTCLWSNEDSGLEVNFGGPKVFLTEQECEGTVDDIFGRIIWAETRQSYDKRIAKNARRAELKRTRGIIEMVS